MSGFYSEKELSEFGFIKCGKNVQISKKASIYGAENMSIGNNVRIDDFCVLSGKIMLGNYIHIAVYSALFGGDAGIEMKNFSTVSSRCAIYAKSDDYSGSSMTNPTIPLQYLHIINKKVIIGQHVIIGSGCTILPGVKIGDGCAVGAMSLINKSLKNWKIYAGIPCKYLKERKKDLLEQEKEFLLKETT